MRAFVERGYTAGNVMVTVAGPIGNPACSVPAILKLLEPYTFPVAENPLKRPPPPPFPDGVTVTHVPLPDTTTVRITLAWPLRLRQYERTAAGRRQVAAVHALSNLLTGGFSSRLLKRLRVQEGLVYSVSAGADLDERDPGFGNYQIATSVDADDVAHLLTDIFDELARMSDEGPLGSEMEKYHMRIRTAMERRVLDASPGSYVDDYANQVLFTRRLGVRNRDRFADALAVTSADIRNICQNVVRFLTGPVVCLHGGTTNVSDTARHAIEKARVVK